jgi:hypothetical protein
MVTYKQMHSILLKDGRKHLVDIDDWATMQLKGVRTEEYDQFVSDFVVEITPFYRNLLDSGHLIANPITETIPESNIKIIVGYTHTWTGGEEQYHPKHQEWEAKFAADPAVIVYNPPILVVEQ